jgi:sigma-B regulation protein RsbQ
MVVPPEVAEFLHRSIRGSRLEIIDTAGHLPRISAPVLVASAIRRYLTDTAPA